MPEQEDTHLMPLGLDAAGKHTLDLRTGAIVTVPFFEVEAPEDRFIDAEDLSSATLRELFQRFGYGAEYDDDGELLVSHPDANMSVVVEPDESYVWLLSVFQTREDAPLAEKYAIVNRVNGVCSMIRFSIADQGYLVAEYMIPYDDGLRESELLLVLDRFSTTLRATVAAHNDLGSIL